MDWASVLTPGVISALISGVVSITVALVSYHANKKKTKSEIDKMKLEWEHQDKVRREENRRIDQLREQEKHDANLRRLQDAAAEMFSAISLFGAAPDGCSHQAALSAVAKVIAIADGELVDLLDDLMKSLGKTDPFEGLTTESQSLLQQVRIQLRK